MEEDNLNLRVEENEGDDSLPLAEEGGHEGNDSTSMAEEGGLEGEDSTSLAEAEEEMDAVDEEEDEEDVDGEEDAVDGIELLGADKDGGQVAEESKGEHKIDESNLEEALGEEEEELDEALAEEEEDEEEQQQNETELKEVEDKAVKGVEEPKRDVEKPDEVPSEIVGDVPVAEDSKAEPSALTKEEPLAQEADVVGKPELDLMNAEMDQPEESNPAKKSDETDPKTVELAVTDPSAVLSEMQPEAASEVDLAEKSLEPVADALAQEQLASIAEKLVDELSSAVTDDQMDTSQPAEPVVEKSNGQVGEAATLHSESMDVDEVASYFPKDVPEDSSIGKTPTVALPEVKEPATEHLLPVKLELGTDAAVPATGTAILATDAPTESPASESLSVQSSLAAIAQAASEAPEIPMEVSEPSKEENSVKIEPPHDDDEAIDETDPELAAVLKEATSSLNLPDEAEDTQGAARMMNEDEKPCVQEPIDIKTKIQEPSGDTDDLATLAAAALDQGSNEIKLEEPKKEPVWCDVGIIRGTSCFVGSFYEPGNGHDPEHENLTLDGLPDYANSLKLELEPGTAYKFRVAAINSCGRGPWSEISAFKTCLPGYPGAPSSIKISKSAEGAHLSWEPPSNPAGTIIEYSVCLAVRNSNQTVAEPGKAPQLAFVRVYNGPQNQTVVPNTSLAAAHIDTSSKPAIIFRIAAKNEKGFGPATQVRWLQDVISSPSGGLKTLPKKEPTPTIPAKRSRIEDF